MPEHLYTMHNQNSAGTGGYYYANTYTNPTLTESNRALFAFYASEVTDAYYIYDYSKGQWLSYSKAASYSGEGGRGFVTFSDNKPTGMYFKASKNTKNGDTNYQLQPYNTSGNAASTYINWYGGVGTNSYTLDGQTSFGRYKDDGSKDNGSAWTLKKASIESAQALLASTTEPANGKPEHLYTMHNQYNYYIFKNTSATQIETNRGKFAFYAVDGVSGAYYIYSYGASQWLSYTKNSSYEHKTGFITLSSSKVEGAYFKISTCIRNNKLCYQLQPYTSAGTAAAFYLNWFQGIGDNNPTEGNITLGIYEDPGSKDSGSAWTITETDKTISDDVANAFSYNQDGITVTLKRTLSSEYWNTFCVPFNIDAETVAEKFGAGTKLRTFANINGSTMNFTSAESIEAGKPYLIKPVTTNTEALEFTNVNIVSGEPTAVGDGGYQMVGTYGLHKLELGGTNLFLGDGDKFYQPADETQATMKGMRAYFVVPAGTPASSLVANIDGVLNSIDHIDGGAEVVVNPNAPVYNLNGQRVGNSLNGLSRGVYVQDGKKYVVK